MCNKSQLHRVTSGCKRNLRLMCCSEMKPRRSLMSRRHLNAGFVVGFLLIVLTYLLVSQQYAVSAPYVVITKAQRTTDKQLIKTPGDDETEKGKVVCTAEGFFSESCEVDGDVRINGAALSVTVVTTNRSEQRREWRIRPYAQRNVDNIRKVTVTQVLDPAAAPPCTVTYSVPAVLFAIGGHSGRNYWHDFADVLVPLFIASRRYDGEVQFLISNIVQPRWLVKYETLLQRLSKYHAVDVDGDAHMRCFPHVSVGLHIHKLFSVVPERAPGGRLTMADFTRFLRETYALPRGEPAREPDKKPRLLLIQRKRHRRFVNDQELAHAAEAAGFETVVMEGNASVAEQARMVNSFDVMLGVQGAGLTNAAFLPPGGVLIQVVPYGKMESIARADYGDPAIDMGLKYIEYGVTVEESTLLEMLGPEHPAIKDPESVHRSGWLEVDEFYLRKQDVRLNITRFSPALSQAFDQLHQR